MRLLEHLGRPWHGAEAGLDLRCDGRPDSQEQRQRSRRHDHRKPQRTRQPAGIDSAAAEQSHHYFHCSTPFAMTTIRRRCRP
jgi:hypothetical protein